MRPAAALLGDAVAEHRLHQRVEAGGRLVQQQQLDVGGQRRDQGHLLPVALGVGAGLLASGRARTARAARRAPVVRPPRSRPSRSITSPPVRFGHSGRRRARRPAAGAGSTASRHGSPPSNGDRAGVGAQQPEQHPQGRRLAGTVRAEEPVHLTGRDREVEPVQRARRAEGLLQPGDVDRRFHTPIVRLRRREDDLRRRAVSHGTGRRKTSTPLGVGSPGHSYRSATSRAHRSMAWNISCRSFGGRFASRRG